MNSEKSDAQRIEKHFKTTQSGRLLKRRIKDYLYRGRKNLTSQNFTTE